MGAERGRDAFDGVRAARGCQELQGPGRQAQLVRLQRARHEAQRGAPPLLAAHAACGHDAAVDPQVRLPLEERLLTPGWWLWWWLCGCVVYFPSQALLSF